MLKRVLVVNAGSSTMKLSVLDQEDLLTSRTIEAPGGRADEGAVSDVVDNYGPFDAVGHRVVHGGTDFTEPVLVDDDVVRRLEALTPLAPLHQPGSLAGLEVMGRLLPGVPAVACFDTAFHATIAPAAFTYAMSKQWRERWGLRRYGFHGLSHAYAARRVHELLGREAGAHRDEPVLAVTCHLGAGASLAAVRDGTCVDTTMGFTPLEGLVMATRSGTVDPGMVLWLALQAGASPAEISDQLEHRSGLAGLAGTGDMREVLAAELAGEPDAALAMGVYLHRLGSLIGSMVASLGGLGVLVFTGGVGERSAAVRSRTVRMFGFLGAGVDTSANEEAEPDCEVTAAGASVRTFVIAAREDLEILRGVRQVLAHDQRGLGR
jgi:acetate kinase